MGTRLELHSEFLKFLPNVLFQPPNGMKMVYPCIIYNKSGKSREHANNDIYIQNQEYQVTVIDRNPDSDIADRIEKHFEHAVITQYYTVDNLNHVSLNLYY